MRKKCLKDIKNNENSSSRVRVEQLNAENMLSRYIDVVLPYVEPIHPHAKDSAFTRMCDFPEKYIKLPKCSCVLNCCSQCTSIFVSDSEMNDDDYKNIPFIRFHHYKNISSCFLRKQLFPEHGKTCPSCMNIENIWKRKVTTQKIIVL